jgi:hydrogenase maturation factor HypE
LRVKYKIFINGNKESQGDLTTLLIRELGKPSIFKKSTKYMPVKKMRKNNTNTTFSTSNKRLDSEFEEANIKDENVFIYLFYNFIFLIFFC